MIMICQITSCKKEFEARNRTQKYCKNDHYRECQVCKANYALRDLTNQMPKTCGKVCANKLQQTLKLCAYPGCHTSFKGEVRAKYCKNDHYRNCKICNKGFKILGIKDAAQTCSFLCANKLTRASNITRYQKDSRAIQEKKNQTRIKNKGSLKESYRQGLKKNIETKIEKYGSLERFEKSKIKKYHQTIKNRTRKRIELINSATANLSIRKKPSAYEVAALLQINLSRVKSYVKQYPDKVQGIKSTKSIPEQNFKALLISKEITGFKQEQNIYGNKQRADFYFPSVKLGIEINPYNFHTTYGDTYRKGSLNSPKPKLYHYNKTFLAKQQNIELIHLYDWDLNNETKLNDLLSYIKQKLTNNLPPILPLQSKEPKLHWYNKVSKEHIVGSEADKEDYLKKGFVGIYDDGTNSKPF